MAGVVHGANLPGSSPRERGKPVGDLPAEGMRGLIPA